ncbi:hypothetical protein [Lentzea kentuckyensis]|uniref:hypothetical protein n=1 Tax=Lentzea kentuckyensis TaxID=360086 RepID=UPI000A3D4C30|nr:hypothetical protein [Lentzea kentuckyensis]
MKQVTAKALDRSTLLVATLGLAAKAYDVPSRQLWDSLVQGRGYISLVLLTVAGVFGALTPFENYHNRSVLDRNVLIRRRILAGFGQMLEISSRVQPPLGTGDLAMHIWQRKRTLRHPVSGVLVRVSTYRMSVHPANRGFSPKKGVGVIGLCWQHNKEVFFNAAPLIEKLQTEQDFDEHVEEHGAASVMNLKWNKFREFSHRTALLATPIRNGRSRFIGCVSVDASRGFEVLNCHPLIEEMTELGLAIGRENFECT